MFCIRHYTGTVQSGSLSAMVVNMINSIEKAPTIGKQTKPCLLQ